MNVARKPYHRPILALLVLLALAIPAAATGAQGPVDGPGMQSGSYRLQRATYAASAGGNAEGASYQVHGTLGQGSVARSQGISRISTAGIWRGISAANVLVLEKGYRDGTPPVVEAGDEIIFVVAVTNNGYRMQEQVVVTDTLPAGLSLVDGSVEADVGTSSVDGDTITLNIARLTYEQIAVLTYRARVESYAEGRTITNTAFTASSIFGPIQASAAFRVREPYRILLPIVARGLGGVVSQPSGPVVHDLQDAPDYCPAHGVAPGDHLYRDDWDFENDNDWYAFDAVAGQAYTIQTSELETRADTIMALYASDCETLLEENDDVFWPNNVASRIVWTAPDTGAYCVMVRSFDWRVYGEDTGYTFGVTLGMPATGMDVAPASDGLPIKPPSPPTPEPGSGRSAIRPPGKASILPQKPPPEPTPVKPVPQPTPQSAPSQRESGGGESGSDLTSAGPAGVDPVLLPRTGGSTGSPGPWVLVVAGLLFVAGGGSTVWRRRE